MNFDKNADDNGSPDWLGTKIFQWDENAPAWSTALECRGCVRAFSTRTTDMRKRLQLPLIVASLGGTGTGKSTLVNAILGKKIVREGKERPTTQKPVLLCKPNVSPQECGINVSDFIVEKHDIPALERLILIDCPDPDTTENAELRESNLARLRAVMPLCDVLIVTGTQQKYRSRRVADELAVAAPGARLVFVQTHADRDADIRDDWASVLAERYETGHIFFVDSHSAFKAQQTGNALCAEFTSLRNLLTKDFNEEYAIKIRQANYVDLANETVILCKDEIAGGLVKTQKLQNQLDEERRLLGSVLADRIRLDLLQDQRLWEIKLVSGIASQWGYSPFALLLRIYQNLGVLASGALLTRVRSVPQLALWGVFEGARKIKAWSDAKKIDPLAESTKYWEDGELRKSALIVAGFAQDAGLSVNTDSLHEESKRAGDRFCGEITKEMESLSEKMIAKRNTLKNRIVYEFLFGAMLFFLLSRPAKNFFIDSVFYDTEIWGLGPYFVSLFWLIMWSAGLLGVFIYTLRFGLDKQINAAAENWHKLSGMSELFRSLQKTIGEILCYQSRLESIGEDIQRMEQQSQKLDKRLGRMKIFFQSS